MNMAQHAVFAGNRVRIFSLEMSEEEVRARFHVFMAKTMGVRGVDLNGLRDRTTDRRAVQGVHRGPGEAHGRLLEVP